MRHILLTILMLTSLSAHAQLFYYDAPAMRQQLQPREKYTAPRFKGGKAGMETFMLKHFNNPASRQPVDGKIIVALIVSPKGRVIEAQAVRSLTEPLNAEAIRVARLMRFKPATLGKKKTKARIDITFPIRHGRLSFIDLRTTDV